jgi:predicted TPR repeat methyltransferase
MDVSDSPPVKLTFDEAMAMALQFQQQGSLAEAAKIYHQLFDVEPDHPDLLHFAGVLAHQAGKSEQAAAMIERSLELAPGRPECLNNLGIVYKALGRVDDAEAVYRCVTEVDPLHANAYSNLGVLLKAQGRREEAEAAYRKAIELDPDHADAYHNLGVLLASRGRHKEAVICYCKVTTLSPRYPETRRLLALAYCTLGQTHKAVEIYEHWLAEEPDSAMAKHMLAACTGKDVPVRADDKFVEDGFDAFAQSFESKLANLEYRAPQILAAVLADSGTPAAKALDVLDAGCGTGLCGPLLAPYARTLSGVDLSAKMLDQARPKGVYDRLDKGELTAYLQQHPGAYDLVVSADTLCYFGALEEVAAAAARALRPGGQLLFTVEAAPDADPSRGYTLAVHGRYGHRRAYVEQVLKTAGFTTELVEAELRMESGMPVAGLAVRAVRVGPGVSALYSAEATPGLDGASARPSGASHA